MYRNIFEEADRKDCSKRYYLSFLSTSFEAMGRLSDNDSWFPDSKPVCFLTTQTTRMFSRLRFINLLLIAGDGAK